MTQFDLNNFTKKPDGTYTKKKSAEQPRDLPKKSLANKLLGNVEVNKKIKGEPLLRHLSITLMGEPMPKQSVRGYADGSYKISKSGKKIYNIFHYQPKEMEDRTKDYIRQIKQQLPEGFIMFENRVHITKMHFLFSPLKGFQKQKGTMERIHNWEIVWKETKPDLPDNLKKLVNDSMSGVVYKDDGIIVSEDNIKKYYGRGGCIIIEMEGY
jgi:Holliday junction resolvase RusA-like endonuclease